MAVTPSTMPELGRRAPDFELPDTGGEQVSLSDFEDAEGLLVVFLCNHCPYVKHVQEELAAFASEYMERGLAVVGINANDAESHPADRPEKMREEKERVGYPFPYLFDESQEVAKAYGAACTPDFFLHDDDLRLFYRGQFDASRPGNDVPVTGADLRDAADRLLRGDEPPEDQRPSAGCNIKWKPGAAPAYAGG